MYRIALMLCLSFAVSACPGPAPVDPPGDVAEEFSNASFEEARAYDSGLTSGWTGTDQGLYTVRSQDAFTGSWAVELRNPVDGYRTGPLTLQSDTAVRALQGAEYRLGFAADNPAGIVTFEVHWRDDLNQCATGGDGACVVSRLTVGERAGGYYVSADTVVSPTLAKGRTLYASIIILADLDRGESARVDDVVFKPVK